jgi:hypothetical protein
MENRAKFHVDPLLSQRDGMPPNPYEATSRRTLQSDKSAYPYPPMPKKSCFFSSR